MERRQCRRRAARLQLPTAGRPHRTTLYETSRRHRMPLPTHLRPRRVLPLLSLAVVMLLTTGFMGSRAPAPHPRVPPSVHVTKLTVTATEFALAPAALEAAAGQPVEVTFINKGASTHNWAVPSLAATSLQVLSM